MLFIGPNMMLRHGFGSIVGNGSNKTCIWKDNYFHSFINI